MARTITNEQADTIWKEANEAYSRLPAVWDAVYPKYYNSEDVDYRGGRAGDAGHVSTDEFFERDRTFLLLVLAAEGEL